MPWQCRPMISRLLTALALACAAAPEPSSVDTEVDSEVLETGPIVVPSPAVEAGPANVLLVLIDDVGVERIGVYDAHVAPASTPNLDGLAAEGIRFTRAWSNPTCSPTRASILTGRHGHRTGVGRAVSLASDPFAIDADTLFLPRALTSVSSAMVGKWHLSSFPTTGAADPLRRGFATHRGSLGNLLPANALDGLPQDYFDYEKAVDGELFRQQGYITTDEVDDAIELSQTLSEPWFIMLSLHGAHAPLHVPPGMQLNGQGPFVPAGARFDLMVEHVDQELGRVFDAVGSKTTVVVLGDNGTSESTPATGEDATRLKKTVYEGGVRVPLIVRASSLQARGSVHNGLVHVTDLFPTVVELMGGEVDPTWEIDGHSFAHILADPSQPSRREHMYTEWFSPNGFGPYEERRRAIRDDRFKLVRVDGQADEFYDLGIDWREGSDLMEQPLSPDAQAAYDRLAERIERDRPDL